MTKGAHRFTITCNECGEELGMATMDVSVLCPTCYEDDDEDDDDA